MTTAAFPTTVTPITTPLIAASEGEVRAALKPFVLIGAVAFMIGFGGYLAFNARHAAVAPDHAPASAVSTPAATPLPDAANPPQPV